MEPAFPDDAGLLRWIGDLFPDEGEPRIEVRKEYSSFHHRIELFRVSFGSNDPAPFQDLFLRTYLGELCWWVLEAPELPERERTAWAAAGRANVPVPGVRGWRRTDSSAAALLEAVPGVALWYKCTPESVGDAARVLARLHGLALEHVERTRFPDVSVTALLERWRGWSEGKGTEEFREALEAVGESLENVSSRPPALLHGDCHGGNFLTDGRKIVAVLDWESSAFGDPRIDLANMDSCLRRWNSEELADAFLLTYEKAAGWTAGDLRPWKDLLVVRDAAVTGWIERQVEGQLALPPTRPESWLEYGRGARRRVSEILARRSSSEE